MVSSATEKLFFAGSARPVRPYSAGKQIRRKRMGDDTFS
jgi:hypothetical protein